MDQPRSSAANVAIIALLTANLAVSLYTALRPSQATPAAEAVGSEADVDADEAQALAARLVPLFNAGDSHALYEQFDPLAKVQLPEEEMQAKFAGLNEIIGKIDDYVFSNATVEGRQGGRTYYKLIYKVRLTGGPFSAGELSLTAVRQGDKLGLFGFFLNGTTRTSTP